MSMERYQRHSLIDWFSQQDVKASKYAVVGCGAIGNEVAKNLALLGCGNIDLYDFDTIEVHNLTRSVLFREDDVGLSKAEVAASRVKELDQDANVRAFVGNFWEKMTLSRAQSYDAIISCVDNFEARIQLNQICMITKTNFINTGIDSKYGQVEIFPFGTVDSIACYECNLPNSAYERIRQRYSCGWLKNISFIEKKIPTTIITSSLAGSIATSKALNFLRNGNSASSERILIDSFTGHSSLSEMDKSESCAACATIGKNISLLEGAAEIGAGGGFLCLEEDQAIITSEPILVAVRCVNCSPNEKDFTVIFKKASDYDSTITICSSCGSDSVELRIQDSFSLKDLNENFAGLRFPCKFVRFDGDNQTFIIELE